MILIRKSQEALEWFQKERVIIFPTETVYGLGAVASDNAGVEKVYQLKNRPTSNPLIIHFASLEQLELYCCTNQLEKALLQCFSPGPITLLLHKRNTTDFSYATANSSKICARIPFSSFAHMLINSFGPIAAPSCNISGRLTITNECMLSKEYKDLNIGAYINDEQIGGIESTIVEVRDNSIYILREGIINQQELMCAVKDAFPLVQVVRPEKYEEINTPGSYFIHYQITKPLYIQNSKITGGFHIGKGDDVCDFNLSPTNNIVEIHKNYFYSLFLGDRSNFPFVTICSLPDEPMYDALRDRLFKTLKRYC